MEKETYEKWVPNSAISDRRFYYDTLKLDENGLEIIFSDEARLEALNFVFSAPRAIKITNESDRLKTQQEHPELCVPHVFFVVKNSEWSRWLLRETYEESEQQICIHYVFATPDEIIEVLSDRNPALSVHGVTPGRR